MTKKYINSWRPHEKPYVQAMALTGASREEAEERLWAVNMRLGAPYRGYSIVRMMGRGAFGKYANGKRKQDALHDYQRITKAVMAGKDLFQVAEDFNCGLSKVGVAIRTVCGDGTVNGSYWADWEKAYIMMLHQEGLTYRQISDRLAPISRKLGRRIRTRTAIAEHVRRLKKNDKIHSTTTM